MYSVFDRGVLWRPEDLHGTLLVLRVLPLASVTVRASGDGFVTRPDITRAGFKGKAPDRWCASGDFVFGFAADCDGLREVGIVEIGNLGMAESGVVSIGSPCGKQGSFTTGKLVVRTDLSSAANLGANSSFCVLGESFGNLIGVGRAGSIMVVPRSNGNEGVEMDPLVSNGGDLGVGGGVIGKGAV